MTYKCKLNVRTDTTDFYSSVVLLLNAFYLKRYRSLMQLIRDQLTVLCPTVYQYQGYQ